jgi:hypothetical protein
MMAEFAKGVYVLVFTVRYEWYLLLSQFRGLYMKIYMQEDLNSQIVSLS